MAIRVKNAQVGAFYPGRKERVMPKNWHIGESTQYLTR